MGSCQSSSTKLDTQQWVPLRRSQLSNPLTIAPNPYAKRVLLHRGTRECLQEYELTFLTREQLIEYRQQAEARGEGGLARQRGQNGWQQIGDCPFLYPLRYFIDQSTTDLCTVSHKANVYADIFALQLSDLQDIPYPDQLHLLFITLHGFKVLYQTMGFIDIIDQMVFLNQEGKAQVWMHPNVSSSQPFYRSQEPKQRFLGSQSQMITTIIEMIESRSESSHQGKVSFRQHLHWRGNFGRLSFYQALNELDLYCLEYKVTIPQFMGCVTKLYSEGQDSQSQYDHSQVLIFQAQDRVSHLLKTNTPRSSLLNGAHSRGRSSTDWVNRNSLSLPMHRESGAIGEKQSRRSQFGNSYDLITEGLQFDGDINLPSNSTFPVPPSARSYTNISELNHNIEKEKRDSQDESVPQAIVNAHNRFVSRQNNKVRLKAVQARELGREPRTGMSLRHKDSSSENAQASTHPFDSNYSDSSAFSSSGEPMLHSRPVGISYYTPTDKQQLDDEIAQDIGKYLGLFAETIFDR